MMIMMDEKEARFVRAIITYERWFSLHVMSFYMVGGCLIDRLSSRVLDNFSCFCNRTRVLSMSTKVVGSQRPKASCKSYLVVFLSVNLYPFFTFSVPNKVPQQL